MQDMNEEASFAVSAKEVWAKVREIILSEEFSVSEGGVDYAVDREELLANLGPEPPDGEIEFLDGENVADGVSGRVQDMVISRHVSGLIDRGEMDVSDHDDLGI